jgi:hypothetical protein
MTRPKPSLESDGDSEKETEGNNRALENLVLAGFFVVLVAAGVWLLATMADVRKAQDCAGQGRRNCATIEPAGRFQ